MKKKRLYLLAVALMAVLGTLGTVFWLYRMLPAIGSDDFVTYTRKYSDGYRSDYYADYVDISIHADGTVMLAAAGEQSQFREMRELELQPTPLLFARKMCARCVNWSHPQHTPPLTAFRLLTDLHYPPTDIAAGRVPLAAAEAVIRDFRSACDNPFRDRYNIGSERARLLLARLAMCDWQKIAAAAPPRGMNDGGVESNWARWKLPGTAGSGGGYGYDAEPFAEVAELCTELRDELRGQTPLPDGAGIIFTIPGEQAIDGRTIDQWLYLLNDTGAPVFLYKAAMRVLSREQYRFPDGTELPAGLQERPGAQDIPPRDAVVAFARHCNLMLPGDTVTEMATDTVTATAAVAMNNRTSNGGHTPPGRR